MNPVFEDDFWRVKISWSRPIAYEKARDKGSDHDETAHLYMITARFSDNDHKFIYLGKTYKQYVQKRLKAKDHRARYAAIIKNHPRHSIFLRYGTVKLEKGKVTDKRINDLERILIYCLDDEHSKNIKSIYSHGVTDSYEITSSGSRGTLPKSPGGLWTFPFLTVENSVWAASSMKAVAFGEVPTHYCVISGSDIVDVLAVNPPEIAWATIAEVESVMRAAQHLGAA